MTSHTIFLQKSLKENTINHVMFGPLVSSSIFFYADTLHFTEIQIEKF